MTWDGPTKPRTHDRRALAIARVVVLATTHLWAFSEGYLRPLELATDSYEREAHAYDLLALSVSHSEAALRVCTETDAELHALLESRAPVWRSEP